MNNYYLPAKYVRKAVQFDCFQRQRMRKSDHFVGLLLSSGETASSAVARFNFLSIHCHRPLPWLPNQLHNFVFYFPQIISVFQKRFRKSITPTYKNSTREYSNLLFVLLLLRFFVFFFSFSSQLSKSNFMPTLRNNNINRLRANYLQWVTIDGTK